MIKGMPIQRRPGLIAVLALLLAGCALPSLEERHVSTAITPAEARAEVDPILWTT